MAGGFEPSPDYSIQDLKLCRPQVGNSFVEVIHMEECWLTPPTLTDAGSPSIKVFQAAVMAKSTG
jgi:hypothetical protein